jgi:hypothetical protein
MSGKALQVAVSKHEAALRELSRIEESEGHVAEFAASFIAVENST